MKNYFKLSGLFVLVFFSVFAPKLLLCQEEVLEKQVIESLEFREVDIKDVLRQLAKQFNLNIVFSEKVTGVVTVQLSNVTVDEALDSIVTVNGFVYTKKGTVIKVTTPEEAEREGKQTRLFKLNNADAAKLKDTLKKVLTPDGSIEADKRSNSLVVTDTLSVINKIEEMIPGLDEVTPQVLIEARLIETSLTNTEKLGIDWAMVVSATGAKRPTTAPFKSLDHMGMEEFTPLSKPTVSGTVGDFPSVGTAPPLSGFPYGFPYAVKGDFTVGTLDFTGLQAVFDFLMTRSNTKLVANPRIVTLNNQKATINVGKAIPIATYERNETTGKWEITGWEDEKEMVGINLEVTPQVSPDGHIKLKLKPEVSSIFDWITDEFGNKQRPITTTRVAETEVQIKDGQTVVIGGLVKTKDDTRIRKVPILGDIPILGFFFTRREVGTTEEPREKTDLLIFVTARIIKDTDERLLAWEAGLVTTPGRPFKLEAREVK